MPGTTTNRFDERLSGRIVVVSPHLDDAVMSLGSTMARAVQAGAAVQVLTVFACDPASDAPAGPWDSRSGFTTEADAARRRRAEDHAACSILGVTPRWLDFGAEPYEPHGSEEDIWAAVAAATDGADSVFIPGYPVAHRDHAAISRLVLSRGLVCRRLALYAEQPYAFDRRNSPRGATVAPPLADLHDGPITWGTLSAHGEHRRMKFNAVRAYRSQLGALGFGQFGLGYLRLKRLLWHEARQGGEAIAWLK